MIKQITVPDLCSTVAEKHARKGAVRLREGKNNLFNMKNVFALKLDTKAPFSLLLVCFFFCKVLFFLYLLWRKAWKNPCLHFFFFPPDGCPIIRASWCLVTRPGARAHNLLSPHTHIFFFPLLKELAFWCLQHAAHWRGHSRPAPLVQGSRPPGEQALLLLSTSFWPILSDREVPGLLVPASTAARGLREAPELQGEFSADCANRAAMVTLLV